MQDMKRRLVSPALFLLFLAAVGACHSSDHGDYALPGNNKVPPEIELLADDVTEDLQKKGYEVERGYMRLFTNEDCADAIAVTGQCFGQNPTAPYPQPVVPAWNNEYIDWTLINTWGKTAEGYLTVRRFDPREATLIFGLMPPAARYFGYQTYVFTREGEVDTTTEVYEWISTYAPDMLDQFFGLAPNGRLFAFSSISNNNNNVVFEEQAGEFFDRIRCFISTPDQVMDQSVRASLANSGVPTTHVVTEPIPSSVTVGLGKAASDFVSFFRYALPENEEQSETWRQDLPLVVLRVRDRAAGHLPEPYPPFEYPDPRTSEEELWLSDDLDALNDNVRAAWGMAPVSDPPSLYDRMIDMQRVSTLDLVGPDCMRNTMNCWGDTQDTSYCGTQNLPLERDGGHFLYAVVGTLGTKTGNAAYTTLAAYRASVSTGVADVADPELETSQQSMPLGPNPFENGDKLFVWYFGRSCDAVPSGNCTEISETQVPVGEPLVMAIRNYIHPGTPRGPNTDPAGNPQGLSPLLTPWIVAIPVK